LVPQYLIVVNGEELIGTTISDYG